MRRQINCLGKTGPVIWHETYSRHWCKKCQKYFSPPKTFELAVPNCRYARDVVRKALRLHDDGLSYREVAGKLWEEHFVKANYATVRNWVMHRNRYLRQIPGDEK